MGEYDLQGDPGKARAMPLCFSRWSPGYMEVNWPGIMVLVQYEQ